MAQHACLTVVPDTIDGKNCPPFGTVATVIFIIEAGRQNEFATGVDDIWEEASWIPRKVATDDTKYFALKEVVAFTMPLGEATEGGINPDGAGIKGQNAPSTITFQVNDPTPEMIESLKGLKSLSHALSVILIDNRSIIRASATSTGHKGFTISPSTYSTSSLVAEGGLVPEYVQVSFSLVQNWDENVANLVPTAPFQPRFNL